ncbi:hypothetical protein [Pelobacter seleniigenes]|uniref:hypothetical protein n=1 Tax=Pelobacter seleniigenes TaxID=407188 RepID=UPI0004A71FBC|nr:hypothetical protein [Pelobacter seleniigenes]
MADPFLILPLENGGQLHFIDLSNRYFGDFHKVRVQIVGDLPVGEDCGAGANFIRYETELTQMAVRSAEIVTVRSRLVDNFIATSVPYLIKKGFGLQLQRKIQEGGRRAKKGSSVIDR